MTILTDISIMEMAVRIVRVEGARVFDVSKKERKIKLALALPDESELVAIISVLDEKSFLDVSETPKVTPMAYMKVNDIVTSYDLQPIAYSRKDL